MTASVSRISADRASRNYLHQPSLLQQNLDEELAAAEKIKAASEAIFQQALGEEVEDEDSEPESKKPAKEKTAERKSKEDEKAASPQLKKKKASK